jgi:hypothetical protein
MSAQLSPLGPDDQSQIDVNEDRDIRYWTEAFGVSEARLRIAVASAGSHTADVRDYLGVKAA